MADERRECEKKDFWAVLVIPKELPLEARRKIISKVQELNEVLKEVNPPGSTACTPIALISDIHHHLLAKACC